MLSARGLDEGIDKEGIFDSEWSTWTGGGARRAPPAARTAGLQQNQDLGAADQRVFFFQAEDGIRDGTVTGVQTCALPISSMCTRATSKRPRSFATRATY